MKRKTGMLWRLLAGSLIAMPLTSYSQTETETAPLEVEMGLGNSITLECNRKLSFGVTRVAIGDDANGEITLDPNDSNPDNPSFDQGSDFEHDIVFDGDGAQLGECTLSGSVADENKSVTVSFPDNGKALSGDAVLGLGEPTGTNNDAPTVTLDASSATVDANGGAKITIGGTLAIYENSLSSEALGGYSGTMDVKVEVNP